MITRFGEIGLTGRKAFKCACGRRVRRSRRFYQTLNPWNKNAAGAPKSQAEILAECREQFVAWFRTNDPCNHLWTRPVPAPPKPSEDK